MALRGDGDRTAGTEHTPPGTGRWIWRDQRHVGEKHADPFAADLLEQRRQGSRCLSVFSADVCLGQPLVPCEQRQIALVGWALRFCAARLNGRDRVCATRFRPLNTLVPEKLLYDVDESGNKPMPGKPD